MSNLTKQLCVACLHLEHLFVRRESPFRTFIAEIMQDQLRQLTCLVFDFAEQVRTLERDKREMNAQQIAYLLKSL